jgi:hypothetical protein
MFHSIISGDPGLLCIAFRKLEIADLTSSCYKYGRIFGRSCKMSTIPDVFGASMSALAFSPRTGAGGYFRLQKLRLDSSIDAGIDSQNSMGKEKAVGLTPTFFVNAIGDEQNVTGIIHYPVLREFFDTIIK